MKNALSLQILLLLFTIAAANPVFSDSDIAYIPNIESFIDLSEHVYAIEAGADVSALDTLFQQNNHVLDDIDSVGVAANRRVNIGLVNGNYWFSTRLHNESTETQSILLEFDFPQVHSLSLYRATDNESRPVTLFENQGTTALFTDRDARYRNITQSIDLEPGVTTTFIWRVNHTGLLNFRIVAWNKQYFYSYVQEELLSFGFIYGLLGMIVLYSLSIYLGIKDSSHFHFALFVSLTTLLIACREGHLFQFFLPDMYWSRAFANEYIIAALHISFGLFCTNFLNLKRFSSGFFTAIIALTSISAMLFVAGNYIDDPPQVLAPAIMLTVVLYICAFFAALQLRLKGVATAGYFAIAILSFAITMFASFLNATNVLPFHTGYFSGMTLGSVMMTLMFTLALTNKMRVLQREQVTASMHLLTLTEDKLKSKIDFYKSKLQETLLDRADEEAKIENRAKNEFLATMSHEIRTPISGVLGMTDLLLDTELSKQQQGFVHYIYNSGQSLLAVIDDLLDYSKMEAGNMSLDSQVFYLDDLIDDCVAIFALKAAEKRINFHGNVQTDIQHELKGDPGKLRQMLLYLLNATYEFDNPGDVTLEVFQTGSSSINSVEVKFEISASSMLLSEQERTDMFVPFSHSEALASKSHEGSGLGLTICKQLAELMHGDMDIISTPEQGTTFWFTSRFILPHTGENADHKDRSTVLDRKRLLIVDEDQTFCNLLMTLTSSWKMDVVATTQMASVEAIMVQANDDKTPFDLLIMPWLADADGARYLLSTIRHSTVITTPVIIATSSGRVSLTIDQRHQQGVDGILEKPVSSKQLYDVLLETLGGNKGAGKESDAMLDYSHLRVLVVEDNKVGLLVIEGLLGKFSIQPISALNGSDALTLFKNAPLPFDLILMDCEMPGMDGYQLTREIRELEEVDTDRHPDERHTLILALSAHTVSDCKDKALASGMDGFLSKPIKKKDIELTLDKYFPLQAIVTGNERVDTRQPPSHFH